MKVDIKQMLSTPRGRLIFSLGLLACSWVFLFFYFFGDIASLLPGADRIAAVKQEIARLSPAYEKAVAERDAATKTRDRYRAMIRDAWIEARDGMVESGLRSQMNLAAQASGANFNNLGSVKVSRINSEFYLAELDVSFSSTYEGMTKFLVEVEKLRPITCWRRLDIRPDYSAMRNAAFTINLAAAANGTSPEVVTRVIVNGAVRVIGYDGKIPSDLKFTPRTKAEKSEKPAEDAKPEEKTEKPAEGAKAEEGAKPAEPAKPAENTAPAAPAETPKPAEAAKPAENTAPAAVETPKPAEPAKVADNTPKPEAKP